MAKIIFRFVFIKHLCLIYIAKAWRLINRLQAELIGIRFRGAFLFSTKFDITLLVDLFDTILQIHEF